MRNPTVSIKSGIEQVITNLDSIRNLEKSFEEFSSLNTQYQEHVLCCSDYLHAEP